MILMETAGPDPGDLALLLRFIPGCRLSVAVRTWLHSAEDSFHSRWLSKLHILDK
jgi:hypothetical protein